MRSHARQFFILRRHEVRESCRLATAINTPSSPTILSSGGPFWSRQKTVNNTVEHWNEVLLRHLGCLIPRKKRTASLSPSRIFIFLSLSPSRPFIPSVIFPCNKVSEKWASVTNATAICFISSRRNIWIKMHKYATLFHALITKCSRWNTALIYRYYITSLRDDAQLAFHNTFSFYRYRYTLGRYTQYHV